jgi:hypothetical protein
MEIRGALQKKRSPEAKISLLREEIVFMSHLMFSARRKNYFAVEKIFYWKKKLLLRQK